MTPRSPQNLPPWSWWRRAFYDISRAALRIGGIILYRFRASGGENVPRSGPVLLIANHQSHFDPPTVAAAVFARRIEFVARVSLFDVPILSPVISAYNTIAIQENSSDTAAMKEILRRLGAGRCVLVFPEGSRSHDGAMIPFKRGISLLIRRARCPVVPIAIEGAFDAWPRRSHRPVRVGCAISVRVMPAIEVEPEADPDQLLDRLARQIDAARVELREEIRLGTRGRWPLPGPGDAPSFPANDVPAAGPAA